MTRSRPYGAVFLPGLDDETVYLRQVDLVGTVDKTGRTGLPHHLFERGIGRKAERTVYLDCAVKDAPQRVGHMRGST